MTTFYVVNESEDEVLTQTSIDEAVEYYVNNIGIDSTSAPEVLSVQEFRPKRFDVNNPSFSWSLEKLYEGLDEDYDPMGEIANRPSDKVEAAYQAFAKVIAEEYTVWSCDEHGQSYQVKVAYKREIKDDPTSYLEVKDIEKIECETSPLAPQP